MIKKRNKTRACAMILNLPQFHLKNERKTSLLENINIIANIASDPQLCKYIQGFKVKNMQHLMYTKIS